MLQNSSLTNYILKGGKIEDGLLMFAKYAFAPNLLEYCGPKNNKIFLAVLRDCLHKQENSDYENLAEELRNLSLQFKAAIPYLHVIAEENNIKDIFNFMVVEAYWLGNNLLNNIRFSKAYDDTENRFSGAMGSKKWDKFRNSLLIKNIKPFHGSHVLNIYSKIDFNESQCDIILKAINNCRINFGVVEKIVKNEITDIFSVVRVLYFPLEFDDFMNLRTGKEKAENFYLLDNNYENIRAGDIVSLHYEYICGKLSIRQKNNLEYWNNYHLKIFNSNKN